MRNLHKSRSRADLLSSIILFLAISTIGIKWIPLVKFGGISLEISNIVQLLIIFVFFPAHYTQK